MDLNNGRICTGKLNFFPFFFALLFPHLLKKEKKKLGWWLDVLDHYDKGDDSMELWRKYLKTNHNSFLQPSFCVHCNQKFLRRKVRNLSETISNIKSIIIKNHLKRRLISNPRCAVCDHPSDWLIDWSVASSKPHSLATVIYKVWQQIGWSLKSARSCLVVVDEAFTRMRCVLWETWVNGNHISEDQSRSWEIMDFMPPYFIHGRRSPNILRIAPQTHLHFTSKGKISYSRGRGDDKCLSGNRQARILDKI